MTITNVTKKQIGNDTGVCMTSCPEVRGWDFRWFFKKETWVEIWLWAGPDPTGGGLTVGDVGTVHIVKIVSLSSCRKSKTQEVNKRSYLNNNESSVFRISLYHGYTTTVTMWALMKFSYSSFGVCISNISWRVSNLFPTFTVYLYLQIS